MAQVWGTKKRRKKTRAEELRGEIKDLDQVVAEHPQAVPLRAWEAVKKPAKSGFETLVDVLSRPNYAVAGAFEESGGTPVDAAKRVGRELFSGIGGIKGEKRSFGDILADRGASPGASFGLGLALDIGLDPTTYLSFGVGAAAKASRLAHAGKTLALSAKGRALRAALAAAEKPRAIRMAEFYIKRHPNLDPVQVMTDVERVNFLSERAAWNQASRQVAEAIAQGDKSLLDPGGIKFMGRSVVAQDRLPQVGKYLGPKITATIKRLEATGPGAGIVSWGRSVDTKLDEMFHESVRKARHLPGFNAIVNDWRSTKRNSINALTRFVVEKTAGFDKAKIKYADQEIPLTKYAFLARDNPQKYPLELIQQQAPEAWREVQGLFEALDVWGATEVKEGLLSPKSLRPNYITHYYDNTPRQMKQLSEAMEKVFPRKKISINSVGGVAEARGFATVDEALDYAKKLKDAGYIKWDLKPVTDIREAVFRRGRTHYYAMAGEEMFKAVRLAYGIDKETARREMFERAFPRLNKIIDQSLEDPAAYEYAARAMKEAEEPKIIERLKRRSGGQKMAPISKPAYVGRRTTLGKPKLKELSQQARERVAEPLKPKDIRRLVGRLIDQDLRREKFGGAVGRYNKASTVSEAFHYKNLPQPVQTLYFMWKLKSATGPDDFLQTLYRMRHGISKLDPNLVNKIREIEAGEKLAWMTSHNEPMVLRKGSWIPRSLAEDADAKEALFGKDFLAEMDPFLKVSDWLQHHFKVGMTVLWPAFHVRNAYNNIAQNFIDLGFGALDPTHLKQYIQVLRGADGTFQTPGRKYTFEEARGLMKAHGVIGGKSDFSEVLRDKATMGTRGIRTLRGVGQKIEDISKVQLFMQHMSRGLSPEEAASRVRQFLFDYDELSTFEREWMRRLIPFYTWQRKNLSLVARELPRRPGRYAALAKIPDRNRGPEDDALPAYVRGDVKIKIRKKGALTYITGIDLPLNSAVETIMGTEGTNFVRRQWQQMNPILRGFGELASNQEAFTGQPIMGAPPEDVGPALGALLSVSPLREYFEYHEEVDKRTGKPLYYANRAKVYLVFKSWAMGRALSYARKARPDELDKWALDFLTGLKVKEFDLKEVEERRLQEQLRRMERDLIRRGLLREGSYSYEATR